MGSNGQAARFQLFDKRLRFLEGISVQLVMHPTPLLAISNDSGIAKNPQVKG